MHETKFNNHSLNNYVIFMLFLYLTFKQQLFIL